MKGNPVRGVGTVPEVVALESENVEDDDEQP